MKGAVALGKKPKSLIEKTNEIKEEKYTGDPSYSILLEGLEMLVKEVL